MPQELNLDVIVDAIWLEIEEQKKDIQLTISERKREDKLWRLKFEKLSGKKSLFILNVFLNHSKKHGKIQAGLMKYNKVITTSLISQKNLYIRNVSVK